MKPLSQRNIDQAGQNYLRPHLWSLEVDLRAWKESRGIYVIKSTETQESKRTMAFTPWAASIALSCLLHKKHSGQGWQSVKIPLPHLSIAEDAFQGVGQPQKAAALYLPSLQALYVKELYWVGDWSCQAAPIPTPQSPAVHGDSGQAWQPRRSGPVTDADHLLPEDAHSIRNSVDYSCPKELSKRRVITRINSKRRLIT